MTPTEKLIAHLANILPRHDWEQQREAVTRMVKDVYDDGKRDGIYAEQHFSDETHLPDVLCRYCGKPTMHMGDTCFSCGQKQDAIPVAPDTAAHQPQAIRLRDQPLSEYGNSAESCQPQVVSVEVKSTEAKS